MWFISFNVLHLQLNALLKSSRGKINYYNNEASRLRSESAYDEYVALSSFTACFVWAVINGNAQVPYQKRTPKTTSVTATLCARTSTCTVESGGKNTIVHKPMDSAVAVLPVCLGHERRDCTGTVVKTHVPDSLCNCAQVARTCILPGRTQDRGVNKHYRTHTCGILETVLMLHTFRTCVGTLADDLAVKKIRAGCPVSFPALASASAIGKSASSTCAVGKRGGAVDQVHQNHKLEASDELSTYSLHADLAAREAAHWSFRAWKDVAVGDQSIVDPFDKHNFRPVRQLVGLGTEPVTMPAVMFLVLFQNFLFNVRAEKNSFSILYKLLKPLPGVNNQTSSTF